MSTPQDDAERIRELVERARVGDPLAMDELCRIYRPFLLQVAESVPIWRQFSGKVSSQDVVQEVFLQLWRSKFQNFEWRGRAAFEALLKTAFQRRLIDHCRRLDRNHGRIGNDVSLSGDEDSGVSPSTQVAAVDATPSVDAKNKELWELMQEAPLAAVERTIFWKIEVEGMTSAVVGALLGMPEGTVRSKLADAKKKLRRFLMGKGWELEG